MASIEDINYTISRKKYSLKPNERLKDVFNKHSLRAGDILEFKERPSNKELENEELITTVGKTTIQTLSCFYIPGVSIGRPIYKITHKIPQNNSEVEPLEDKAEHALARMQLKEVGIWGK